MLATSTQLHSALDRIYKLAASLPDAPLACFQGITAALPRTTEAERLVIQRIGQDVCAPTYLLRRPKGIPGESITRKPYNITFKKPCK
jgi:hypothetical protein